MKISMTFVFNDENRRELAKHYGQTGLASRADIEKFINQAVNDVYTQHIAQPVIDAEPIDGEKAT